MVNLQGRGENASEELKTLDAKVVGAAVGGRKWRKTNGKMPKTTSQWNLA